MLPQIFMEMIFFHLYNQYYLTMLYALQSIFSYIDHILFFPQDFSSCRFNNLTWQRKISYQIFFRHLSWATTLFVAIFLFWPALLISCFLFFFFLIWTSLLSLVITPTLRTILFLDPTPVPHCYVLSYAHEGYLSTFPLNTKLSLLL